MPKHLSAATRESIRTLLLEGEKDHLDIADELDASLQTVKNYSSNLKNFGDILPPRVRPLGRPPLLTKEIGDVSVWQSCKGCRLVNHALTWYRL